MSTDLILEIKYACGVWDRNNGQHDNGPWALDSITTFPSVLLLHQYQYSAVSAEAIQVFSTL